MYFKLTIRPEWDAINGTVSSLYLESVTDFSCKAGEILAAHVIELVTIPFCPISDLTFSDELGVIAVESFKGEAEMSFIHRRFFKACRDTQGQVKFSYTISPRVQPENYHSSPYFDLVAEKGGVLGTGSTFIVSLPDFDTVHDFSLSWDLSSMPAGARGVWSLGTGNCERKALTVNDMLFTAYMTGLVNSREEGPAGFYWFDSLPFNAEEGAAAITKMFNHMSAMFRDKGGDYRVFTRHNHFPSGGGTALTRSYIYGYGIDEPVTVHSLQALLAHEMVHNWPTMSETPAGTGTWYVEGSAEYYCTMVIKELGLASLEEIAEMISCDKAGTYYQNPLIHESNLELGKKYWQDRRAQRLPYSKGVIYLSNIDAQIKRATNGERSLLDIELELLNYDHPTPEDFLRIGSEIAGFDLTPGYNAMASGEVLIPDPDGFGGDFTPVPCKVKINNSQHRNATDELLDAEADGWRWEVRKH